MKNNIKILSVLVICLLLVSGCGKVPKLENGKEAVITFKDGEKISVDDVYAQLKNNYALEVIISMVDKHVFETEFKDYVTTAKEESKSYVEQMKESYGGEDEFLSAIQQYTNYSTVEAYEDYIYLSYLQNHAAEEYSKNQVTEKQIEKYYKEKAKGDIEVSHILITPSVSSSASEDEQKEATEKAEKKAKGIIETLNTAKNNKEDISVKFADLAKELSDDAATKSKGGELGKINYNVLASSYDELIDAAYKLKDGEYSTTIIETELGYHVILKTKSHAKEAIEKLSDSIREVLGKEFLASDNKMTINALQHYRKLYDLDIIDSELNKQYNEYIKTLITNLEKQNSEEQN